MKWKKNGDLPGTRSEFKTAGGRACLNPITALCGMFYYIGVINITRDLPVEPAGPFTGPLILLSVLCCTYLYVLVRTCTEHYTYVRYLPTLTLT